MGTLPATPATCRSALPTGRLTCGRGSRRKRNNVDLTPSLQLADLFRFSLGPVTPVNPQHWTLLSETAKEQRTVRMKYHVLYKDEVQEREVDPYLLRCYSGDWYLIGHDHHTGYIPVFNIARIRELRMTQKRFEVRADFDPDSYFAATFLVSQRSERHTVRV